MVTCLWYTLPNFGSLSWFWKCKEHPFPLIPDFGLWRILEVPDWGYTYWSWFGYSHGSFIQPCSDFWLSILIFKVQRTFMSFKSSFTAFKEAGGSLLGFGILILIMVTGLWYTHVLNLGILSWFQRCKEQPCPLSPDWGFWRMLGFAILILI